MTRADATPLPGEPSCGRHRPARLHPGGIQLDHLIARCGYQRPAHPHTHGGTA